MLYLYRRLLPISSDAITKITGLVKLETVSGLNSSFRPQEQLELKMGQEHIDRQIPYNPQRHFLLDPICKRR